MIVPTATNHTNSRRVSRLNHHKCIRNRHKYSPSINRIVLKASRKTVLELVLKPFLDAPLVFLMFPQSLGFVPPDNHTQPI